MVAGLYPFILSEFFQIGLAATIIPTVKKSKIPSWITKTVKISKFSEDDFLIKSVKSSQNVNVIKMKNMYGKKVRGIERSTFLLDPEGSLIHEWRGVKVNGHINEILEVLN